MTTIPTLPPLKPPKRLELEHTDTTTALRGFTTYDLRAGIQLSPAMRETVQRVTTLGNGCDLRGIHPCQAYQDLIGENRFMDAWKHIHESECPECKAISESINAKEPQPV